MRPDSSCCGGCVSKRKPKKFYVTLTAEIEISRDVLRTAKSKAWAKEFYTLSSDEAVAMFLGRLLALNQPINEIDGFCDKARGEGTRLVDLRAEEATESGE